MVNKVILVGRLTADPGAWRPVPRRRSDKLNEPSPFGVIW